MLPWSGFFLGTVVGVPGPLGVLAGQQLGPLRVGRLDRVDQLGVLGPRAGPALRGDHPVVPLDPAAHDVGQLGEHRVAGDHPYLGVERLLRRPRAAGVAVLAGSLAVSASSNARTSSSSSTSESVGTWTKAPWLGRRSTQPSASM